MAQESTCPLLIVICFIAGGMLYAFSELEWMDSSLTLSAALLLGTICSAVDPVAVNILLCDFYNMKFI